MANEKIVDVLVRLSAEAQTEEVNAMNSAVGKTGNLAKEVEAKLDRLNTAKKQAFDSKEVQALNQELAKTNNLANAHAAGMGKIAASSNTAAFALMNVGRVAQDLPFGFLGIANNLNPLLESFQRLQKESGGAKGALSALGSSLVGAGGIGLALSVVSSLLIVFGDKLFSTGKKAAEAKGQINDFDKAIQDAGKSAAQEIIALQRLRDVIENTNLGYKERGEALDKLAQTQNINFTNLQREKLLNGELKEVYDALTLSIFKRAEATAQYNILSTKQQQLQEAQIELDRLTNNRDSNTFFYDSPERINNLKALIAQRTRDIEGIKKTIQGVNSLGASNAFWLDQNAKKQYEVNQAKEKSLALMTEEERKLYERDQKRKPKDKKEKRLILPDIKDEETGEGLAREYKNLLIIQKALEETFFNDATKDLPDSDPIKQYMVSLKSALNSAQLEVIQSINPTTGPEAEALFNTLRDNQIKNQTRLEALRKEYAKLSHKNQLTEEEQLQRDIASIKISRVIEQIAIEDQLVQSAGAAASQIIDIEVNKNQRILQAQKDRVDSITAIADKGNAAILEAETDRLQKLEERQKRYERTQRTINAALIISQNALNISKAVGAVLTPAAEGDPYSAPYRVAAAVIAVIAGLAATVGAVSSINADTGTGFFKGDYTGDGNPREKAGIVHKREYVFDHESTDRIGVDTLRKLRYGQLALVDPQSKQVVYGNVDYEGMQKDQNYVKQYSYNQTSDNSKVEKKLDAVIGVLSNLGMNIQLDKNGFAVAVTGIQLQIAKMKNL